MKPKVAVVLLTLAVFVLTPVAEAKGGGGGGHASSGGHSSFSSSSKSSSSSSSKSSSSSSSKTSSGSTTSKPAAPKSNAKTTSSSSVKPGSTVKTSDGKTVKTSTTKPTNSKYTKQAGVTGVDGYSPRFTNGYSAPAGSVVYYRDTSFFDYLPWIYLFSHNNPATPAGQTATIVQPDGKQVQAKPEAGGTDGLAIFNWIILILLAAGSIALVIWLVNKYTTKENY